MTQHASTRLLAVASLVTCAFFGGARSAHAQGAPGPELDAVHLTYHGGPLVQHAKVVTLFGGPRWAAAPAMIHYFNGFFQTLFKEGAYMANLGQYSVNGYRIGNGTWSATATDPAPPASRAFVTDFDVEREIAAQVDAGRLPVPDEDTIYCVFPPPGALITDRLATVSLGYHGQSRIVRNTPFVYAVIPAWSDTGADGGVSVNLPTMTATCSRELAGCVTNPEDGPFLGWVDDSRREAGEIPLWLFNAQPPLLDAHGLYDVLPGAGSTLYVVQKVWSNRDNRPVAFAAASSSG